MTLLKDLDKCRLIAERMAAHFDVKKLYTYRDMALNDAAYFQALEKNCILTPWELFLVTDKLTWYTKFLDKRYNSARYIMTDLNYLHNKYKP